MAYSPQTARFGAIARAVQLRIAGSVVADPNTGQTLDPQHVRLCASDAYPGGASAEPFFVVVRFYGPRPATAAGAGRRARPVSRRLRVWVYTRCGLDRYGDDTEALTAEGTGHADREEAVYESLDHFVPVDPAAPGTPLVVEPLHPLDTADGPPERPPVDEQGLLWSCLDFEAVYLLRVSLPDPPAQAAE